MAARRASPSDFDAVLPDPALLSAPIAWAGSPPSPVPNDSRFFPDGAVFVRGEVIVTIQIEHSPGVATARSPIWLPPTSFRPTGSSASSSNPFSLRNGLGDSFHSP
jgi:hypothetical protein